MTNTGVELEKNDGSETFTLKVNNVTASNANNVITHTIVSVAGSIAGSAPLFEKETYELSGEIKGMEAADYPNSGTYSDDDYGQAEELRRATKVWGDIQNGLDTLRWDGRSIGVVISEFRLDQNREQDIPKNYTFTLELTAFDTPITR
ncbi:hypothetical protein M201_gp44 [Haloarcula californiae tailed virus 2]|uniref:Tail tube protein n=1 Tax=Haloarcula californiae tailed virus 2 TaxID=1273747 RepID=R4T7R4_9CAUD|nr:hypothetical protein M201_gp44 [Haloarcula californiae tailed virus 2]AGM11814.1 hypothetical protein HCTV2_43 [Haloarcula californiae tailed virus 2]